MAEQGLNGRCRLQRLESGNETENEDNENNENDGEGEDGNNGPLVPFKVPGAGWRRNVSRGSSRLSHRHVVLDSLSSSRRCSRSVQQVQVAAHVAAVAAALLHRPQLWQAALGEVVPRVLLHCHHLDRRALLHHGLDGQWAPPPLQHQQRLTVVSK